MRVRAFSRLFFLMLTFGLTTICFLLLKNPLSDTLSITPLYNHNNLSVWPVYSNIAAKEKYTFLEADLLRRVPFSTEGDGVLVFLHMQKTGGTFYGRNFVQNLIIDNRCECLKESDGAPILKCPCLSKDGHRNWIFSRYSTGWKCGLHADYTELTECLAAGRLDELEGFNRPRKYHMMTVLREPVIRYLSEFQHVRSRGGSWARSTLRCNGNFPDVNAFPKCYDTETWLNVTLEEFISCPYNLGNNRQTRMLANISLAGCYERNLMTSPIKRQKMLESAKENLVSMPYFALMNYFNESQLLFEETFGLRFSEPLHSQKNRRNKHSGDLMADLSKKMMEKVRKANDLDLQLYNFAKQLFLQRYDYYKAHFTTS